jgi:hypothetical protein
MSSLHIYDGRTNDNEYFWFAASIGDTSSELFLTMPRDRISPGVEAAFKQIEQDFRAACQGNPETSHSINLEEAARKSNAAKWVTTEIRE